MPFSYPPARRSDTVDTYHGTPVADPYRWLEDPDSPETKAFVEAQNAISQPYLESLPDRQPLIERMTELWDIARSETPVCRGDGEARVTVWSHNDGLRNQPILFVRRGPSGTGTAVGPGGADKAEVLLDPNTMSDDGAVAVVTWALSPDGGLLAYLVSEAGSDRQRLAIRSTTTGVDLDDRLEHLRFTSVAWYGDGFFYTRWPETEAGSTAPVQDPSIHYHRIGDAQADDRLIFHNDEDPEPSYGAWATEDDRYLVLVEYLGTDRRNGLLYLDLEAVGSTIVDDARPAGPFLATPGPVWSSGPGHARHRAPPRPRSTRRDAPSSRLIVHTDRESPNGRVVSIDLDHPEPSRWTTLVAEGPESPGMGRRHRR